MKQVNELQCWFEIPKDDFEERPLRQSPRMSYSSLDEMPANGHFLLHCGVAQFDGLTIEEVLQHANYLYSQKK